MYIILSSKSTCEGSSPIQQVRPGPASQEQYYEVMLQHVCMYMYMYMYVCVCDRHNQQQIHVHIHVVYMYTPAIIPIAQLDGKSQAYTYMHVYSQSLEVSSMSSSPFSDNNRSPTCTWRGRGGGRERERENVHRIFTSASKQAQQTNYILPGAMYCTSICRQSNSTESIQCTMPCYGPPSGGS